MNLLAFLKPKPTISDQDVNLGVRWFNIEGMVIGAYGNFVGGALITAFALALGANNLQIGILAAIPSFMQVIQLPATWFVERFRRRKAIALITLISLRMLWFPMAPFLLGLRVEELFLYS